MAGVHLLWGMPAPCVVSRQGFSDDLATLRISQLIPRACTEHCLPHVSSATSSTVCPTLGCVPRRELTEQRGLQEYVEAEARDLSAEAFSRFMSDVYSRITVMVSKG